MSHVERKVAVSNLEQKNSDSEKEKEEVTETEKPVTEAKENETEKPAVEKEDPTEPVASEAKSEEAEDNNIEEDEAAAEEKETAVEEESIEDPQPVEEPKSEKKEPEIQDSEEESDSDEDASDNESEETAVEPEIQDSEEDSDRDKPEESADNEDLDEESEDEADPVEYYEGIAARAKELVVQTDWAYITTELANLAQDISEGPESDDNEEAEKLIAEFQELRSNFEEKKRTHYEELNKKKADNLAKKKDLLKSLSAIIDEKNWTATREVSQIRGKWDSIKLLPQGEGEALDKRFKELVSEFEDHKVDRLVKKLQKEEENLELKFLVLDKMDGLIQNLKDEKSDFQALDDQFNNLLTQWRKIGRVPSEKNQAIWDRYNAAQDKFNEMRFKYDKKYRKKIEKSLEKKKKLVKEAEALVDQENIAKAARKVNKLHRAWKKAGNLPQKEENEMWDKFKEATDTFNDKKSDNIEVLREQEQKNLDKKYALIEKAGQIKGTEDFDKGHQVMQGLMDQWKKIGPVPRKKSSKIWKKFKGEMDDFYDRRRDHFKSIRKDHKENLDKKNEILKKLEELGSHEDPALAVEEAKKLQAEFKDSGHVPIKVKNKIWKQYREACDVIYDRYRALGSDLGRERKLASQGVDPSSRKEIIKYEKERNRLKKEISSLESEIIQYEEARTYFKPTNKGNKLREELQQKIDKARAKADDKNDRIYELDRKMDDLREAEEEE